MNRSSLMAFIALTVLISSCWHSDHQASHAEQHEIPTPLQNDNKYFSLLDKRSGDENLVEAIYADLVKKDSDLQTFENKLAHFNAGKVDSLAAFYDYERKSGNYYSSADRILMQIKDSVLRQRLRLILSESHKHYDGQEAKFRSLANRIESDQQTFSDYYYTLKIAATLPVIANYQNNNIPDFKRIKSIAKESEKLNQNADDLQFKYLKKLKDK